MILSGAELVLLRRLREMFPDVPGMPPVKRKVLDYQMVALYGLAQAYNRPGVGILEIGTGHGGSGYMLAKGAPLARVTSLTIDPNGAGTARSLWRQCGCRNIDAILSTSWDFLEHHPDGLWDMVFVDGDHNQIARDLPWFNRLAIGGLLLCHDYSPQDSPRPSAIVYARLDEMAERLGRPFDVRIVDDSKTGMVGFYRQEGECWV